MGGVCNRWSAEKVLRSDAKAVPKIVANFLNLVAIESRLVSPFLHYWNFLTGRQK
jgi:hypothetical protein